MQFSKPISAMMLTALATLACAQVDVTTYHNDNLRSGLNNKETALTLSNVNPATFGLLFSVPVDGQVYAQPLVLTNVNIPGKGRHNVVYVATEHNSVYAYDADSNEGANATPLWHVNLGPSAPNWDFGSGDITNEIGITGTPVIVRRTRTLYVVAKTKETDAVGNTIYVQRLHALDIATGASKFGGPKVIEGSVPGTGEGTDGLGNVPFNPRIQMDRCALLNITTGKGASAKDTIYIAFGSHGDQGPYHGWLFAYDGATLNQKSILNLTPNAKTDPSGYPIAAGGIWQAGAGPASDGTYIYFMTGNGSFNAAEGSYGDAFVKVDTRTGLVVSDYFAPSNQYELNVADADLGSGGVMLLPKEAGSLATPNLLIGAGKEGTIYLLNRKNMGKYHALDHVVQELVHAIGGVWGVPAYFNHTIYFGPIFSGIHAFKISNAAFETGAPVFSSTNFNRYPGVVPSISADGLKNGIVWSINTDGFSSGNPAVLFAHDASKLGDELYRSNNTNGRDTLDGAVKFNVPTVANGKVYVGTATSVGVFGLGRWTEPPTIAPANGNYQNQVTVTLSDPTPSATIYYTTDGTTPTTSSTPYSGPFSLTSSTSLVARAFSPGAGASPSVRGEYQINAVIGTGKGLLGNYFANTQDPGGDTPTAIRLDPTVNFVWGGASPIAGVDGSNWAAKWVGQIQAETTSPYTFYTNSDDGVRLYINGQLVIDNYTYHAPTYNQGSISLVGGKKYSIEIRFFQGGGDSVMQLFWSAPGMPFQVVPATQLYRARSLGGG